MLDESQFLNPDEKPLNRDQMEAYIRAGRSVSFNGQIIDKIFDLPGRAELAGNDPEKVAAAHAHLLSQKARLDAEIAKLQLPANQKAK